MYSILPALVASVFLAYGVCVICTQGFTRVGISFFVICLTSAFWQGTWAVLFQVQNPVYAIFLIKFGYLLILFLPSSLYHFLVEVSDRTTERRFVYLSYGVAAVLAVFLVGTDLFVSGFYEYFWGYYPRAGLLHPLHLVQTAVVVSRGLYITYLQQRNAPPNKRIRLRLCFGAVLVYFFAAADYLCNYGFEFYPPGVIFIAVSLGIITTARYGLLHPMEIAATVAHELRTPLLSIRMQAQGMDQCLPTLLNGYRLAVEHGLCEPSLRPCVVDHLYAVGKALTHEVDRSNATLDMILASVSLDQIDRSGFKSHSMNACVAEAIERYTFDHQEREKVVSSTSEDFRFHGSDTLMVLVLFNLLKNALYAIHTAGKGTITISTGRSPTCNLLCFTDTGTGIEQHVLANIFDAFFTTKQSGGTGVGLTFCRRALLSFGGRIQCDSVVGVYTTFTLEFPFIDDAPGAFATT